MSFGSSMEKKMATETLIHKFDQKLGAEKCSALLKAHILTGCDVTRKVGTKASAFASRPERYLSD